MKSLPLVIALAALTLVGCRAAPKPPIEPASTPISADALDQLRAAFVQADPNAKLGGVSEVLASEMYLTVADVTAADFPVGTAVAIIDSNRAVIANGEVVRTFDDSVHVRYEAKGTRAPRVGDVAVRF